MTLIEYLQEPGTMAQIEQLYQFGVIKQAQYVHCHLLLAYIALRARHARIKDKECVIILAQNPHYALSEERVAAIIKQAKKGHC